MNKLIDSHTHNSCNYNENSKNGEKIFIDKSLPLRTYPKKSLPPPTQKLGCKSPRVGENFQGKSQGIHGGWFTAKINNCITMNPIFKKYCCLVAAVIISMQGCLFYW